MIPENTFQRSILYGLQRTGRHVYAGTVSADEVARRRARSRAARIARRANRSAK